MPQDTMIDLKETLVPVTMITDIKKSAAEKLIALQTEYMTTLFNTGLAQMKALSDAPEPKEALELQIKFFKELNAKLANITEKEVVMRAKTKAQLMDVIGKNISSMTEVTKPIPNAQEKIQETISIYTHKPNIGSHKTATMRKSA